MEIGLARVGVPYRAAIDSSFSCFLPTAHPLAAALFAAADSLALLLYFTEIFKF